MLTWLKILCAVDFSESSRVALEQAADLAQRLGADLTLLHVREPPAALEEQVFSDREHAEADRLELQGKLERWRAAAERLAARPVRAVVAHGAPGPEIVAAARNDRFDLLVTGTHARRGVRHLLLGSVAERLVREAPCTVLVARTPPDPG